MIWTCIPKRADAIMHRLVYFTCIKRTGGRETNLLTDGKRETKEARRIEMKRV